MNLYLPRRYRRKLLFPPGLLALAGLLWLGCEVVGKHWDRLKLRSVMQITMPPLQIKPDSPFYGAASPVSMPAHKLESFRPWHFVCFTGPAGHDLQTQQKLILNVRNIVADSGKAGGVRITFAPTAHYKDLVFVIDLMNRENVKKYWLDFKHKPTTLFAYTDVRPRHGGDVQFICGTRYIPMPEPSPPSAFETYSDELMAGFKHPTSLKTLIPTPWSVPVLLLIIIAAIGTWRIGRSWHQFQGV
ncbi:hypothetical protein Q3A66_20665 [Hymenobacter sp. BT770]|uniref:hypothetical protein n=1 Tax=Hymenobacter sp. BT770 TaxID=2886942 RepID=UPI001D113045|nr:hypothetical protein [Hymenobacter sp. BT770]MCC3155481.1 hypothetical protein [Hymenobacter sp. BT770]MDO3417488.1 hypothetical protein [Hymenobacter sp. BT770]